MKEKLSTVGALSGAFLASLCCIGPIVLAFLGVGGAGLVAGLGSYRPFFIGFTVVSLGLAYYFTFRRRDVTCEDGTCTVQTGSRKNKIFLMAVTVLSVIFLAFPYFNGSHDSYDYSNVSAEFTMVTIPVEGMTCEGCNAAIQTAVGRLDGVKNVTADYTQGEATVTYDPQTVTTEKITGAINGLGYHAKSPGSR